MYKDSEYEICFDLILHWGDGKEIIQLAGQH